MSGILGTQKIWLSNSLPTGLCHFPPPFHFLSPRALNHLLFFHHHHHHHHLPARVSRATCWRHNLQRCLLTRAGNRAGWANSGLGQNRAGPKLARIFLFRANNLMAQPDPNSGWTGLAYRVGPILPPLLPTPLTIPPSILFAPTLLTKKLPRGEESV